jgi:CRP-like cAMP-binding protein
MSTPVGPSARGNSLLDALPRRSRQALIQASEPVELAFGKPLCQPGEEIRHVYFPSTGYISLITPAGASESLEVGLVGHEGMFGITLLLDIKTSPLLGLVQGSGAAWRMPASRFRRAAKEIVAFRRILHRYLYVLTAQLAQSAVCGRYHLLDARMARWMLMTHDRVVDDTFRLTHEFLAWMLGVRRAGVTEVAGRLQKQYLIDYHRGVVTVLDRAGLESASCPCYQAFNTMYKLHLGVDNAPKSKRSNEQRAVTHLMVK